MFLGDQPQDQQHADANRVVQLPEVIRIPPAVLLSIVPGQKEGRDATRLPRVALGESSADMPAL